MSDNYHFDIASEGKKHFERAMQFAFEDTFEGKQLKAIGYTVDEHRIGSYGLVFFKYKTEPPERVPGFTSLPYEMKVEAATEFAWHWLQSQDYEKWEKEPGHDGSNHKGFRIYNEKWNRIGDWWGAFAAVKPEWMMYGK